MTRPSGLGRGLGALIPNAGPGESGLETIPLDAIVPNPRQPREEFDEAGLRELAHSLREFGLLQPILVRPLDGGRFGIVAGERRFRAARLAHMSEIPAIIRHTGDEALLAEALVENIHRTELNPLEEAAAYQQLLEDFAMTHEALAQRLGKSRSAISNTLRLMSLPLSVQQRLAGGALTAGHARALLGLSDPDAQERLAQRIVGEGLSVRATEELVRGLVTPAPPQPPQPERPPAGEASPLGDLQRRLSDALATKVRIDGSARRGRVVIDYAGVEDLERLLAILGRGVGEDLLHEPP